MIASAALEGKTARRSNEQDVSRFSRGWLLREVAFRERVTSS